MKAILVITCYFILNNCIAQVFVPLGNGFNHPVRGITIDTNTNTVFAGGSFSFSGSTAINGIAQWNGSQWNNLGVGSLYLGAPVIASCIFQNELICGGTFSDGIDTTGNGIGLWTGSNWVNIGNVYGNSGQIGVGGIYKLLELGGLLYLMGGLAQINGINYNSLATWDGANYSGFPIIDSLNTSIYACEIFNSSLYVGGNFMSPTNSSIKDICWFDGTNWVPVGNGFNGFLSWVNCMTVFQGDLYVAGWFSESLGDPGNNIARWDGNSWHPLGTGLDYSVFAMEVFNNELYVGGQFTNAGGIPVNKIAKWNGVQWDSVPNANFNNSVACMVSYGNDLYIGGGFTEANGITANFIGKYSILTSVNESSTEDDSEFQIYPKVSTGIYFIKNHLQNLISIEISDMNGQIIKSNLNYNNSSFDIHENSPGFYNVRICTQKGIYTDRVSLISVNK